MEQVVRRSELRSESTSKRTTPEPDAIAKLRQFEEFDAVNVNDKRQNTSRATEDPSDEDELDFRLFGSKKPVEASDSGRAAHKIRLRSPSIDATTPGFVQPRRHPGYYFTKTPSLSEKANLEASAVTGLQVLAHSKNPWPGSAYSWKILRLTKFNVHRDLRVQQVGSCHKLVVEALPRKRTRPGKKYRIRLRTKHEGLQRQRREAQAAAKAKETAERENRTRKNREKKRKKRERDKAKGLQAETSNESLVV